MSVKQRLRRLERARAKRSNSETEIVVIAGARQDSEGNWDAETARKIAEAKQRGVLEKYMIFFTGNVDPSRL